MTSRPKQADNQILDNILVVYCLAFSLLSKISLLVDLSVIFKICIVRKKAVGKNYSSIMVLA